MPYIDIAVTKKLSDSVKDNLQKELSNNINVIPGKNVDNTIVAINDGISVFHKHSPQENAFFKVHLFKASPEDAKKAFASKIFEITKAVLDIPSSNVQVHFVEMDNWATGDEYMS